MPEPGAAFDLQSFLDQSSDVFVAYDRQLRYVDVNALAAKFLGRTPKEVIGRTNVELIGPGAATIEPYVLRAFETREKVFVVHEIPTPDGTVLFDTIYTPVVGPNGEVETVVGICRDVTENHLRLKSLEQTVTVRTQELEAATADLRRVNGELWAEMDLARKIQTVLLPPNESGERYEIAAVMKAADSVGGDCYDFFRAGGKTWLVIGDVSGHGVSAGLVMMMVQTATRAVVEALSTTSAAVSPSDVLRLVNSAIRRNVAQIGRGQYMTITLLCLDDDGRATHAGLHQDILIHGVRTGTVEQIQTEGVWLGVLDEIAGLNKDATFTLDEGDVVLLFTDGITEARRDGKLVDVSTVVEWFGAAAKKGQSCEAIIAELAERLTTTNVADDLTMMAVRRR